MLLTSWHLKPHVFIRFVLIKKLYFERFHATNIELTGRYSTNINNIAFPTFSKLINLAPFRLLVGVTCLHIDPKVPWAIKYDLDGADLFW